jgi:hypothetical protein
LNSGTCAYYTGILSLEPSFHPQGFKLFNRFIPKYLIRFVAAIIGIFFLILLFRKTLILDKRKEKTLSNK